MERYSFVVCLNNGASGFSAPRTPVVVSDAALSFGTNSPPTLQVQDINGDNKKDIVIFGINDIQIYLGNGDGTFQPRMEYLTTVGSSPTLVDVNGDGKFDIVSASGVILGNGDGTFNIAQPIAFPTSLLNDTSLLVADVNGDGKPDVVYEEGNLVGVMLGNGDGTFATPVIYSPYVLPPYDPSSTGFSEPISLLGINDVNHDGKPDILLYVSVLEYCSDGDNRICDAPMASTSVISVLFNIGNGQFQLAPPMTTPVPCDSILDANGDGNTDLLCEFTNSGTSYLNTNPDFGFLLGRGDGSFQAAYSLRQGLGDIVSGDPAPHGVASADLRNNGRKDLVYGVNGTVISAVAVQLNNGDGTFQGPVFYDLPSPTSASSIVISDVNGDGIPDIVESNYAAQTVGVLLGIGDGTFQAPVFYAVGDRPAGLAVSDVSGDGHPDIVVGVTNGAAVFLGNGDGTFQAPMTYVAHATTIDVAVADIENTGHPDIVLANGSADNIEVLHNVGNGTFSGERDYPLPVAASPHLALVTTGAVHGSTYPDVVVLSMGFDPSLGSGSCSDSSPETITVFTNISGVLSSGSTYAVTANTDLITVADVNGDQHADIVSSNPCTGTVGVLLNDGTGVFPSAESDYFSGGGPTVAADFIGDGFTDIATPSGVLFNAQHAPFAISSTLALTENSELLAPIPAFNPGIAPLTIVEDTQPSQGTLTLGLAGLFIYTPASNFFGDDSFNFHLHSGTVNTASVTAHLHVASIPQVQNGSSTMALSGTDYDTVHFSNSDGAPVTFLVIGVSNCGSVTFSTTSPGTFIYRGARAQCDVAGETSDTFQFEVINGPAVSAIGTETIVFQDSSGGSTGGSSGGNGGSGSGGGGSSGGKGDLDLLSLIGLVIIGFAQRRKRQPAR